MSPEGILQRANFEEIIWEDHIFVGYKFGEAFKSRENLEQINTFFKKFTLASTV